METKQKINTAQGSDKGQFGKSMHPFEAITTSDLAVPAALGLPWIRAVLDTGTLPLHDNIVNVFITLFTSGQKQTRNTSVPQN